MILEILRLINTLLSVLGNLRRPLADLLLQPLVTVVMLVGLYAGWHVRDEGDVAEGLRVAFVDTRANRQLEEQRLVAALMQAELRQYAQAGKLIDQSLSVLLQRSAGAARIRLGVIHNGISGLTGVSLLRYDIVNAVALPGRAPGPLLVNEPLTIWSEFLPSLLAGKCQLTELANTQSFSLRNRLEALGANSLLSCPVVDVEGKLLGAVFTNWDAADKPPSGEQLAAVIDYDQRIGGQIASVLTLRGPPDRNPAAPERADPPGTGSGRGLPRANSSTPEPGQSPPLPVSP